MHPLFKKADKLSHEAIGAAIEVHRLKGAGLLESTEEKCMMQELKLRGIAVANQSIVKIEYKGLVFEEPLRFDILVEGCLLLELKSVQEIFACSQGATVQLHETHEYSDWTDHQFSLGKTY